MACPYKDFFTPSKAVGVRGAQERVSHVVGTSEFLSARRDDVAPAGA